MKRFLPVTILVATLASLLHAQDAAKPALTVYPFGTTAAAAAVSRDLAVPSESRAIDGALAAGRFQVKNETADPAIKKQLDAAGNITQFDSPTQIKRDGQLQSKYLLLGFLETAEVKPSPKPEKDGKVYYYAMIGGTIRLFDVEKGTVIASRQFQLRNGLSGGDNCDNLGRFDKIKCLATHRAGDMAAREDSREKALTDATNKLKDVVSAFLTESVK